MAYNMSRDADYQEAVRERLGGLRTAGDLGLAKRDIGRKVGEKRFRTAVSARRYSEGLKDIERAEKQTESETMRHKEGIEQARAQARAAEKDQRRALMLTGAGTLFNTLTGVHGAMAAGRQRSRVEAEAGEQAAFNRRILEMLSRKPQFKMPVQVEEELPGIGPVPSNMTYA